MSAKDPKAAPTAVKLPAHKNPDVQFKPGQSGNPAGRTKGSRNKLGEAFLSDMYANWEKNGAETIEKVRVDKPDAYLKVVASILPQQLNVRVSELDELTEAQLDQRIDALARALQLEVGTGAASRREAEAKAGKSIN